MSSGVSSEERQRRIDSVDVQYERQPMEAVSVCNLCNASVFTVLTHRDRYGFSAQVHLCRHCGLGFLNPRMTKDAYGIFYESIYRPLVSAYHGRLIDAETVQTSEQEPYAIRLIDWLVSLDHWFPPEARLLDIGGSTGLIAEAISETFGMKATVLDPAPDELSIAEARGMETFTGMLEDFSGSSQSFDLILMCQTIDHLLDIRSSLEKVHELLTKDGLFFVDIVDFRNAYLKQASVVQATKIDHPYYFTEASMRVALLLSGFEIIRKIYAPDGLHIGYFCTKSVSQPASLDEETIRHFEREIRLVQAAAKEEN